MAAVSTNEELPWHWWNLEAICAATVTPGWMILGRALDRLLLIEIGSNQPINVIDD
jgi:hypothetical protein